MLLVAALLLLQAQAPTPASSLTGTWNAWLDSPGGKLAFVLDFTDDGDGDGEHAYLVNGPGRTAASRLAFDRDAATFWFDPYDSHIDARLTTPTNLDGVWTKRSGPKQWTVMPFHARSPFENTAGPSPRIYGRWSVQFEKSDERAVAVIEEQLGTRRHNVVQSSGVHATFLTTLGDYRYLAGALATDGSHLNLSCFDGAHAFLFKAELKPNGAFEGDFWSGDTWHETWSAVRDDNAKLPDPFELTKWNESVQLDSFWFRNLDGKKCLLSEFPGKARILVAFGSWCPNCNDEAEFLRELDEEYRARGLSIVGLAFELTGDFARDAKQVQIYAERHKLAFPLLIAGTSDKEAASKAFPLLDKIRAYPTTIFLHSDGRVRAVHQGYSGPATGAEHTKLREDFERLIEELLAESDKKK